MARTYNDIYMEAKKHFKAAGIGEYSLEARLLLAHLADKTPAEFLRDLRLYVSKEYAEKSGEMIKRRADGEPIAYLTGYWVFYGLPLKITKDVLIPRMDTEIVVDTAIRLCGLLSDGEKKAPRILDLCCGSGCIGLALANNILGARLTMTDNSKSALKLSGSNAVLNKLASRVSCLNCDVFDAPPAMLGTFDLIVSNPPYVKTDELNSLDRSVRDYEPRNALDGGTDGLIYYRRICENWVQILNDFGYLVFECGIGQSKEVERIGRQAGLTHIESVKDTLEIDRAIVFQKKPYTNTQ